MNYYERFKRRVEAMSDFATGREDTGRVLYTLDKLDSISNAVFLAGGTVRQKGDGSNNSSDVSWRFEAVKLLRDGGYVGDILFPEWYDNIKPDGWSYASQVEWELEGLYKATTILFYIPRDMEKLPCLTTNIEYGNFVDANNLVVITPKESEKNDYIKYRNERLGRPSYETLEEGVKAILNEQDKPKNYYFTSDTHFSAERTLTLSKRPFHNVLDMDLKLIHNWNSTVSTDDVVYHLGDFGNPEILKCLNFSKMYLLLGNYERDNKDFDLEEFMVVIDSYNLNVEIIEEDSLVVDIDNNTFEIVHEPSHKVTDNFGLFGHVHRLSMIKNNMLNVGTDCHFFKPISLEDVLFQKNGIENHYDDEVFMR